VRADIPLVGDLKIVLGQLNARLTKKENTLWWQEIAAMKERSARCINCTTQPELFISAGEVLDELNRFLPEKHIITTDVGQHQIWAAQKVCLKNPRSFISSGGLGTMGYGIPAAVGAQVACPQHTVVTITGDGSFQMGMPELGTALEQNLPLKIVLLNNQTLGMVKQLQDHYCGSRYSGVFFAKNPNFEYLAKAYGALYHRVEQRAELSDRMAEIIKHPGLAIIEVLVSSKENTFPVVLAGQGLNEMVGLEEGELVNG